MNVNKLFITVIVTLAITVAGGASVYSLPEVDEVVVGDVHVESNGSTMTFSVASDKAIINLSSFDIAAHETVQFCSPSA